MGHDTALIKVAENGRLSVPARQRKLLGLEGGGLVVARVEGGELRIRPVRDVIADLQARVARYDTEPASAVDWLLQERRREVARDELLEQEISEDEHTRHERDRSSFEKGEGSRTGR
jgi:AbrB family looped-hinge helix DNA binding protein